MTGPAEYTAAIPRAEGVLDALARLILRARAKHLLATQQWLVVDLRPIFPALRASAILVHRCVRAASVGIGLRVEVSGPGWDLGQGPIAMQVLEGWATRAKAVNLLWQSRPRVSGR